MVHSSNESTPLYHPPDRECKVQRSCGIFHSYERAESTILWKRMTSCSLSGRKRPWAGIPARKPRWTESVNASSSAPTWSSNAIISLAKSSGTSAPKNCSENPWVRSGPSGNQTSTDRFGKPGLMLIVMFGHRK